MLLKEVHDLKDRLSVALKNEPLAQDIITLLAKLVSKAEGGNQSVSEAEGDQVSALEEKIGHHNEQLDKIGEQLDKVAKSITSLKGRLTKLEKK